MMEQAQAGHGHGDIVFIARFDDIVVADGAAGLGDVVDAAAMGPFNVVAKGEEGIAAQLRRGAGQSRLSFLPV